MIAQLQEDTPTMAGTSNNEGRTPAQEREVHSGDATELRGGVNDDTPPSSGDVERTSWSQTHESAIALTLGLELAGVANRILIVYNGRPYG
jgi:hypothetical protein